VLLTDALHDVLMAWVERRYRDRLAPTDVKDPKLARETMEALDELTEILRIGSVYDFQR
jgi:succinylarginine dihydrolase